VSSKQTETKDGGIGQEEDQVNETSLEEGKIE